MSQSNWIALWEKLGLVGAYPTKRVEKAQVRWGTQTEELENRALLSAATHPVDTSATVEAATNKHMKPPVVYPTIAGSWHVTATGVIGDTAGTAVITVTQKKPNSKPVITSVITVEGVSAIHSTGKFDTENDHVISGKAKVAIPGVGNPTVTLKITFDPGTNPTHFSGTVSIGKAAPLVTFNGNLPVA
ncbi:MAG: hypothetical protein JWM11_7749 [Planctomycetaceae bacterium]|nr:hypothetical protein [Planctomycetaceae bacterium]